MVDSFSLTLLCFCCVIFVIIIGLRTCSIQNKERIMIFCVDSICYAMLFYVGVCVLKLTWSPDGGRGRILFHFDSNR